MDPTHPGDVLKLLEKQQELVTSAYNSMSHELHQLQVEEEMLMRKYYEYMSAQGLTDQPVPQPAPVEIESNRSLGDEEEIESNGCVGDTEEIVAKEQKEAAGSEGNMTSDMETIEDKESKSYSNS